MNCYCESSPCLILADCACQGCKAGESVLLGMACEVNLLSISTSRDAFLTTLLRLRMYLKNSLVVLNSDSNSSTRFSAALCILWRVGRSALSIAFCVRSGVFDSSLLCSVSSFWSGSSSSSGASGASELDELEDELSYEEDSCVCSFSAGVSFAGLGLLDLAALLASSVGAGGSGRWAAIFPASTLVAFSLFCLPPLAVVLGGFCLGDFEDDSSSTAWLARAGLLEPPLVVGTVLAISRKSACMTMYSLSSATMWRGDSWTVCGLGGVGSCSSEFSRLSVLFSCHLLGCGGVGGCRRPGCQFRRASTRGWICGRRATG